MKSIQYKSLNSSINKGEIDIRTGPFGTQLKASDYVEKGTPVINVRNIGYRNEKEGDLEFVGDKIVNKLKVHRLCKNDIIFGRKGAVDRHLLIKAKHNGWIQGSDCIRIRFLSRDPDPDFLSFFFLTEGHKKWIEAQGAFGATMGSLNQGIINRICYPNFDLPIQRKIAAILSAYDDLIENSNRRIDILEKTAEELYREWFVRLRFPGHEKVKIITGVPEGWEVRTVDDSFDYCGGGTPSTADNAYWNNGGINWYSPTDITSTNSLFSFQSRNRITELGLKESSARLFPAYSVMLTSRATIGEVSINTTPACTNQGFITCIPNERISLYYLFYWLRLNKELFIQLANGATFLEITKGKFKKIMLLIPEKTIMGKYNSVQMPIFNEVENLLKQQSLLTSSRDRLLSRLMSGKIDVENLGIRFPPSMRNELDTGTRNN